MDIANDRAWLDELNRVTLAKIKEDKKIIAKCKKVDSELDVRLDELLCKECFYKLPEFANEYEVESTCKLCGKTIWNPNSDTDDYCNSCCNDNVICRKCGKPLF